jgi:hypothetical protein
MSGRSYTLNKSLRCNMAMTIFGPSVARHSHIISKFNFRLLQTCTTTKLRLARFLCARNLKRFTSRQPKINPESFPIQTSEATSYQLRHLTAYGSKGLKNTMLCKFQLTNLQPHKLCLSRKCATCKCASYPERWSRANTLNLYN